MSKTVSLKKNTIANYIGQFYSILIGIVILPLYLQYLGAEAYGLVGFFTMLMSWMMLLDIGMTGTLAREAARLKDKINGLLDLKELIRSIESLFIVIAILIVSIIYFSSASIATQWLTIKELPLEVVENAIKLMGFMIIMRWFVGFYQGAVVGFEQQVWLNGYKVFFNTLKFVGAFLLIKYITNDILNFFIYQFVVGILEFFVISYKVYNILPHTQFLYPSLDPLKKIAPFALSIAFTSGVWIIFTQADKLLLSHYIPLAQYGYFTLVVVISGAIMQLSAPITQAMLPRMTSLISNNKEDEMLALYHQGTQLVSIVIFSVVAIIAMYPYELLYAWSGDMEASRWAAPILTWYALGYGFLAILAFQYYLQYAYGNLKYHVRFNIYFPVLALPIIYFAITNYGALGAGVAWFSVNLVSFLFWPAFVHHKFARGIHAVWLTKDILPALVVSILYSIILKFIQIDFTSMRRDSVLVVLILLGLTLLFITSMIYPNVRHILFKAVNKSKGIKNV